MKTIEVTCDECRETFEMDEEKFDRLSLNEQGVRIIHEGRPPLFCSNKCGDGADLHRMGQGTGLHYDFAVIRPRWDNGKNGVVLRLERWIDGEDPSGRYEASERFIVSEDVSNVPDDQLCEMLEDIHYELIPEDFEEDDAQLN